MHHETVAGGATTEGEEPLRKTYKYHFHVGVGLPDAVMIETIAHRTGYRMPDNKNYTPPDGTVAGYDDHPDMYRTRVDIEAVVEHVKAKTGYQNVTVSSDPGLYLCAFIFYVSMAESRKAGEDSIVMFIHVPPENDPYSVEQDREIVREIINYVVSHY